MALPIFLSSSNNFYIHSLLNKLQTLLIIHKHKTPRSPPMAPGSISSAITSLMTRAASSVLTLAPHPLPLCLFLDSLPVYDGSPSAVHTASSSSALIQTLSSAA